jgi:nucleotide-binding universal stress UspA family protein
MTSTPRLITVAIHTFNRATQLKQLLEREGVEVTLQNVNLESPVVSAGVRVRIPEVDLPLALRIIENEDLFTANTTGTNTDGASAEAIPTVLVPVNFSPHSQRVAQVAFSVADELHAKVVLLNAYSSASEPLSAQLTFDEDGKPQHNKRSRSKSVLGASTARESMRTFTRLLLDDIKAGKMPAVKYATELVDGVPEEAIAQYIKSKSQPRIMVMGTRNVAHKATDMIGSVTAEVLDGCRVMALTVPEGSAFSSFADVKSVTLLSMLEQEDFLALDAVSRLLSVDRHIAVTLICLPGRKDVDDKNEVTQAVRTSLLNYCREHYPNYTFTLVTPHRRTLRSLKYDSDLVVVPNRKKNIFARLFNPGIAHRLLFSTDVPMLVIPV